MKKAEKKISNILPAFCLQGQKQNPLLLPDAMLFNNGIHTVIGIKNNMKNQLMPLYNRIMRRKRSVIETINDQLKNICDVESMHLSIKPSMKVEREMTTGQLQLFC